MPVAGGAGGGTGSIGPVDGGVIGEVPAGLGDGGDVHIGPKSPGSGAFVRM